ncbi:MAG: serine protease [Planctomycetes bacterium]|nr:serine protease [Planctomycetota bacterium]
MQALEYLISDPFASFLFIGAGMLFLLLEVFVPSGGVLGFLSLGCTLFGIYGLFQQGRVLLALGAIGGTSTLTVLGIRYGLRRLSFSGSLPLEASSSADPKLEDLRGKRGVTHTALRPAGVAVIQGKRVDVVAEGTFIEPNMEVEVVDNTGNRVVVRAVAPSQRPPAA